MALSLNEVIEIGVRCRWLGQEVMNVWQYVVLSPPVPANVAQVLEAYWNHVKTTYRAIVPTSGGNVFESLTLKSLTYPLGDYGEFAIPLAERAGTRAVGTEPQALPPFNAVGVRLTVATRATRPGQKRFPFMVELDNANGSVQNSIATPVNAHMAVMVEEMLLGAPAATTNLGPIVVRKFANGAVNTTQPVTGYVTNLNVTTQNSRKIGKGV